MPFDDQVEGFLVFRPYRCVFETQVQTRRIEDCALTPVILRKERGAKVLSES